MGLLKQNREFRCQAIHLFFKRLTIVFLLLNANIATRSEDIILCCNIFRLDNGTEALNILQSAITVCLIRIGNLRDVFFRQLTIVPILRASMNSVFPGCFFALFTNQRETGI